MSSVSYSDTETELSGPEEEEEPEFNIGLYIGGRDANNERHGRGWAILPNGDQYDGQYRHGKRHGIGLYVFKGGARYYGKYRCGHRSGRGIFIYPDGSMYEGHWRKNIKEGKGRYNYANGDSYNGDWHRGKRHGVGVYSFKASGNCTVRIKATWRQGVAVGPFEAYFGSEDKCTTLHGTWDNLYPQGPAVFSFDERYMLLGYFQSPPRNQNTDTSLEKFPDEESCEEEGSKCAVINLLPSLWFAQDIVAFDYSQLPQEPVPLPISDSDLSVCSLSTVPTEGSMEKSIDLICEGEPEGDEGEGEYECGPCECSTDLDYPSEPCDSNADPCDIDRTSVKL